MTLADGAGVTHAAVIKQVRKHAADLEQFGTLAFEMATFATSGGEQSREFARLNERRISAGASPRVPPP